MSRPPDLVKRQHRIDTITRLLAKGVPQVEIATELGMGANNLCTFIRRYMRTQTVCKRPEVLAKIKPLIEKGLLPNAVAERTGVSVETVRHYARRYCHRPNHKPQLSNRARADLWGSETADPSTLTAEQLDVARRVGITPERFAWLCAIPKNPDAKRGMIGHRGGNSIG